jgi:hypothetical protein
MAKVDLFANVGEFNEHSDRNAARISPERPDKSAKCHLGEFPYGSDNENHQREANRGILAQHLLKGSGGGQCDTAYGWILSVSACIVQSKCLRTPFPFHQLLRNGRENAIGILRKIPLVVALMSQWVIDTLSDARQPNFGTAFGTSFAPNFRHNS